MDFVCSFRSKQKRPDAAIYVPRARRQQDRLDACPQECTIDARQEQAQKKPTVKNSPYVPRMRRSQLGEPTKQCDNQQLDSGHCGCYEPPDGAMSHTSGFAGTEDSRAAGNSSRHKSKRKKGSGRIMDEKTGRNVVREDRKQTRSDAVVRTANVETSECGENDRDFDSSLCSDDAILSRSAKRAATDESGCASRDQSMEKSRIEGDVSTRAMDVGDDDAEFHNVVPPVDVLDQSDVQATEHPENEQLCGDPVRLPTNREVDVSCDHNYADVSEHGQCANSEQPEVDHDLCIVAEDKSGDNCAASLVEIAVLESDGRNEKSTPDEDAEEEQGAGSNSQSDVDQELCIIHEDTSGDNCAANSGEIAVLESDGRDEKSTPDGDAVIEQGAGNVAQPDVDHELRVIDEDKSMCISEVGSGTIAMLESDGRNEKSTPDEDAVVKQGAGDNEQGLDGEACSVITHEKDLTSQDDCHEENTNMSHNPPTNNCVVSVLGLTVYPESSSENVARTTERLTAHVSDSDCNVICGVSGDDCGHIVASNLSQECCASEVAIMDGKERRRNYVDDLDDGLTCDQDSETNGINVSSVTSNSESVTIETREDGRETNEETVCDEIESESKMHVQSDVEVIGSETDSKIQDENPLAGNETCGMKNDDSEGCSELRMSVDEKCNDGQLTKSEAEKKTTAQANDRAVVTSLPEHREDAVAMDTDDEEEDSWDKLFDDSGEALDPRLVEEVMYSCSHISVRTGMRLVT